MRFAHATAATFLLAGGGATAAASAPIDAGTFSCPTAGDLPLTLTGGPFLTATSNDPPLGTSASVSLTTSPSGEVCVLSLLGADASPGSIGVPVVRSYDGGAWEVRAGPFAGRLATPACSAGGSGAACDVVLPADGETLGGGATYVLTTYARGDVTKRVAAARFLEQTTFGQTLDTIDVLASTSDPDDASSPDFASWVEAQQFQTAMSSHREFFRRHTNPRFEYPFSGGGAGPDSACDYSSRWRTFALSERDGLVDFKTSVSKYLSIKELGGPGTGAPYVWYVEGMARTVTQSLPAVKDGNGNVLRESLEMEPEMYQLEHPSSSDYYKSACVGCPVPVRVASDGVEGFVENPKVDLTGIEADADLVPYGVVPLPDLHSSGSSMVPVDDEPFLPNLAPYQQAGDEFWLNTTIDPSACAGHPDTIRPLPSKLDDVTSPVSPNKHVEGASAPIFGRATNSLTGQKEALLFDPHFEFKDNTPEHPLPNGGGRAYVESVAREEGYVHCSNAPQTFLNEDQCQLSHSPDACYGETAVKSVVLSEADLLAIRQITGRFVVAVDGLPLDTDSGLPCDPSGAQTSRWTRLADAAPCASSTLSPQTASTFAHLLDERRNANGDDEYNPILKDVTRSYTNCDAADNEAADLGHVLAAEDGGTCWRHVHPAHLNVYDLTGYVHDGQPIENLVGDAAAWTFPPTSSTNQDFAAALVGYYDPIGKLDDLVALNALPAEIAADDQIATDLAFYSLNPHGDGVVVCGSPGEVASDFTAGTINGFDLYTPHSNGGFFLYNRMIYKDGTFTAQKHTVWSHLALNAEDQLRQRVAWALYQILPVAVPSGFVPTTEVWLAYYDIFVRNAFGNYRDILKEVSYNGRMGDWLSFEGNTAAQYGIDKFGKGAAADENYAREIMQLFSVGLFRLNMDGTKKLDPSSGEPLATYDSDHITSYARAWTGFEHSRGRGNAEEGMGDNNDPMPIDRLKRDIYPKSDLSGGYVGDGYPFCTDLPPRDHLRKGATYILRGKSGLPRSQTGDQEEWETMPEILRLRLDPSSSPLRSELCRLDGSDGDSCTYPSKVVLGANLDYSSPTAQAGDEYNVDTIRTVLASAPGDSPVYYEYLRPPCVETAFFADAKKINAGTVHGDKIVDDTMCADPRRRVAAEACCLPGWDSGGSTWIPYQRACVYNGERMTFASAGERCAAHGFETCHPTYLNGSGVCMHKQKYASYVWTTAGCAVRAKISFVNGQVARVDHPEADYSGQRNVPARVRDDSANFFAVPWNADGTSTAAVESDSCASNPSCYSVSDGCVCDTAITDTVVFASASEISSKEALLSSLKVGAFPLEMFDAGEYTALVDCGVTGVQVYSKGGTSGNCDALDADVIFQFTDENGVEQRRKNVVSTVSVSGFTGGDLSFRNPVHFIDFVDMNLRDMHYETDAVLDTYFYHPSSPPFLANLVIQRFGVSNPSPSYVESVATAYKTGTYGGERFGSGKYGDLGAMVAATILEPEARSLSLDADPSHGHLREPVLKLTSFLRSQSLSLDAPLSARSLAGLGKKMGQSSYGAPSVFSFFLPDFSPPGPVASSGLVAPEGQVLDTNNVLGLLDGLFSTVKFGISDCHGGLGYDSYGMGGCPDAEGDASDAHGKLTYVPPAGATTDEVLDELSLLLTSGRLVRGSTSHAIVKAAFETEYGTGGGDLAKAVRIAQQLIAASPEFHSTNAAVRTEPDAPRQIEGYSDPPRHNYRAVVYLMLMGGCDSFNLLVPKGSCRDGRDVHGEYVHARGAVALDKDELLDIDATGSGQVCDAFGVHKDLPILQQLYNEKRATFVANMGVLTQRVTKHDDYLGLTKVQLFAHNHMQRETEEVDPLESNPGTGVGGRVLDILSSHGFQTSANAVEGRETLVTGGAVHNNPVWTVSQKSLGAIDDYSSLPGTMLDTVKALNGVGSSQNSLYGETWSSKVAQSLFQYEEALAMNAAMASMDFTLSSFSDDPMGTLNQRLLALTRYMAMRDMRKVDREVFVVRHDGYDMHSGDTLTLNFAELNGALTHFIEELKGMGVWEDTVIVMGSDFGRSITPNSGGGTDHAWGGNYFMVGGSVNGGKILGQYPEYLSEQDSQWTGRDRGRFIPTTPWDAIWNGVANWMGVKGDDDLGKVLPNRDNFDRCDLYTDMDLFVNGQVPHSSCSVNDADGDGVTDDADQCPNSPYWNGLPSDQNGCQPPTMSPTPVPTAAPTAGPTGSPTNAPNPTSAPSRTPTTAPTSAPTVFHVSEITPVATVISQDSSIVKISTTDERSPEKAIDGNTDKFMLKMATADETEAGFEVTPAWPHSIVQGIRVYTANTYNAGDPSKFVIKGRNNDNDAWTLIAARDLDLTKSRNPSGTGIESSPAAPDGSLFHEEVKFQNIVAYSQYRVTFPETRDATSTLVQVGEVELPGVWLPEGAVMTPYPTAVPTDPPTPIPTFAPSTAPTTAAPTLRPTDSPTITIGAVSSVLAPGSTIVKIATTDDSSPEKAIDGNTEKFVVKMIDGAETEAGFEATPVWPHTIVQAIRVYTGNDGSSRDPTKFVIKGRTSNADEWSLIAQGDLSLTKSRNPEDIVINSSPTEPDVSLFHQEIKFQNTVAYSQYRVTFPETRNSGSTILQFAEVELPGLTVPESFVMSQYPTAAPTIPATPVATIAAPGSTIVKVATIDDRWPEKAIDGNTLKFFVKMADEFETGAGFEVTPAWPHSIVQGIRVYNAVDGSGRDPTSFVVEGRNGAADAWAPIASGVLDLTTSRNPSDIAINSTSSAPDTSLHHQEVKFHNTAVYSQYRVTFPETRTASSTIVQFGEVELPGVLVPGDGYVMTQYPTAAPTTSPTPAPTAAPTLPPTEPAISVTPMNSVLTPGSPIVKIATTDGRRPERAIDGNTYKFFVKMASSTETEAGFEATPTWPHSVVQAIRVYTGNDGSSRDPTKFVIKGRNGDADSWALIAQGDLSLTKSRNPQYIVINSTPTEPDGSLFHQEVKFQNTVAYSQYRVTFPETRNSGSTIVQFAEVELPGLNVPEGWTAQ